MDHKKALQVIRDNKKAKKMMQMGEYLASGWHEAEERAIEFLLEEEYEKNVKRSRNENV